MVSERAFSTAQLYFSQMVACNRPLASTQHNLASAAPQSQGMPACIDDAHNSYRHILSATSTMYWVLCHATAVTQMQITDSGKREPGIHKT